MRSRATQRETLIMDGHEDEVTDSRHLEPTWSVIHV